MPTAVVLSLGSNLGDRKYHLGTAIHLLGKVIRLVRISSTWATDPVDCQPDSLPFLNLVAAGTTTLLADELLREMLSIEKSMGRVRKGRNAPRPIDIDLIFFGGRRLRSASLVLPHPRYADREFVLAPLRELDLGWFDAVKGQAVGALRGKGSVRRVKAGW